MMDSKQTRYSSVILSLEQQLMCRFRWLLRILLGALIFAFADSFELCSIALTFWYDPYPLFY